MLVNQFRHIKETFLHQHLVPRMVVSEGNPQCLVKGTLAVQPLLGLVPGSLGGEGSLAASPTPGAFSGRPSFRRAPAEVWSLEMECPGSWGPLGPGSPAWSVGGPPQLMPHYSLPATYPRTCHLGAQAALRGGVPLSSAPIPHTR